MADQIGKATPGPWTFREGICRNDHPDTSADVHGAHGQFVADCGCHDLATANAEFIVRACNNHDQMIETLKAAFHALKSYAYGNGSPDLAENTAKAIERAITKAEGLTP